MGRDEMMAKVKHFGHLVSSILLYALLMILLVIVLMVGATVIDHFISSNDSGKKSPLFGAYVIISPSMVPNINVYDAVVTIRTPEEKIEMYDVITFLSKDIETHGIPITHRVVGILETESGERGYRTKGDNNNGEDKAIILQKEVIGKVFLRIPMLGYVRTFVTSKIGFLVAIVLPLASSFTIEILRAVKRKKENEEEII